MMNSQAKPDEASNNEIDTMTTVPNESTTIDKPDESSNKKDDVEMEDVQNLKESPSAGSFFQMLDECQDLLGDHLEKVAAKLAQDDEDHAKIVAEHKQEKEAWLAEKATLLEEIAYLKGRNEVLEKKCWPWGCFCWWR